MEEGIGQHGHGLGQIGPQDIQAVDRLLSSRGTEGGPTQLQDLGGNVRVTFGGTKGQELQYVTDSGHGFVSGSTSQDEAYGGDLPVGLLRGDPHSVVQLGNERFRNFQLAKGHIGRNMGRRRPGYLGL
eukprot:scaffold28949_cov51-Attheya_sp.AAC.1